MKAKRGPRGGVIRSGRCKCDYPALDSVKAVRAWIKARGTCSRCGDDGIDLIQMFQGRYHVRCFVRNYGLIAVATMAHAYARVRLCCIGCRRMGEVIGMRTGRKPSTPTPQPPPSGRE